MHDHARPLDAGVGHGIPVNMDIGALIVASPETAVRGDTAMVSRCAVYANHASCTPLQHDCPTLAEEPACWLNHVPRR